MNEDINLIELIESEVLAFGEVSRFADATLMDNLQQAALLRRDPNPSISIKNDDGIITISIEIIVYYGVNIPQLCYDIQTKVRKNLQTRTGLEIKAVNIIVDGIDSRPDN
ncbi:MAG: Asp23/Gls24 family envelope stress response protein [Mogibacterium sp.]|nr:Asp23/Gls24 family envelope stress response protein [Mogibacterium sp.]